MSRTRRYCLISTATMLLPVLITIAAMSPGNREPELILAFLVSFIVILLFETDSLKALDHFGLLSDAWFVIGISVVITTGLMWGLIWSLPLFQRNNSTFPTWYFAIQVLFSSTNSIATFLIIENIIDL